MIARSISQILLDAKIFLSRLNGIVTQRQLNLIDRRAALVSKLGERSPQVVRSYAIIRELPGITVNNVSDGLRRDRLAH